MIKVFLYRCTEMVGNRQKPVIESAVSRFDYEVINYEYPKDKFPYRDESSLKFLQRTFDIHFADDKDRYALVEQNHQCFPISELAVDMKQALVLISESKKGYYTHVNRVVDNVAEVLDSWHEDLLFAFDTMLDKYQDVLGWFHHDIEIVNWTYEGQVVPLILVNEIPEDAAFIAHLAKFNLYRKDETYYARGYDFFEQFDYDYRLDLPFIKDSIDRHYKNFIKYGEFTQICHWEGVPCKIVSHLTIARNTDFLSRRMAFLQMNYMMDGSVEALKCRCTCKYPTIEEILEDLSIPDHVQKGLFLVIDVHETLKDTDDIFECEFGGFIYPDYIEVFGKDACLMMFADEIPFILKHMKISDKRGA